MAYYSDRSSACQGAGHKKVTRLSTAPRNNTVDELMRREREDETARGRYRWTNILMLGDRHRGRETDSESEREEGRERGERQNINRLDRYSSTARDRRNKGNEQKERMFEIQ